MNYDHTKRFPNQRAEHRFWFCVGEGISDILTNYYGVQMDPDFSVAAGLYLKGQDPWTAEKAQGIDAQAAMYAACAFGAMPEGVDDADPLDTSDIEEATWSSYTVQQEELAAHFTPNGVRNLRTLPDIKWYLKTYGMGCGLIFKWYGSWENVGPDGVLPTPKAGEAYTYHFVACYEIDGYLRLKPWLGPNYGIEGYCWMSPALFDKTFVAGYAFDSYSNRFVTLVKAALSYPQSIPKLLPAIYNSANLKRV